jgi:hypothetical protein
MAGFSAFAPQCRVAGPNGLDLKEIQTRVKFKICFKFGLKKILLWLVVTAPLDGRQTTATWGFRQLTNASYVTKKPRPSITSWPHAHIPGKCGGAFLRRSVLVPTMWGTNLGSIGGILGDCGGTAKQDEVLTPCLL